MIVRLAQLALGSAVVLASAGPGDLERYRQSTRLAFEEAKEDYLARTNDAAAAWRFGRAAFDWADLAGGRSQRAAVAREGIEACERAVRLEPDNAAGHYYLAMNRGQLARSDYVRGLKLVKKLEAAFGAARRLDERFDHAGPDRNLGVLYRDAPGWPISIGDRVRARRHMERAVELSPDYPENRLNLAESLLEWKQEEACAEQVRALGELMPRVRAAFAGNRWLMTWPEWEERRRKLVERMDRSAR